MVGRGVVLDVAIPRPVLGGKRVVGPVGERRQGEQRVRRAAAAQVDLERVRTPAGLAVLDRGEVDRSLADDALPCETTPDLQRLRRDPLGVGGIGREVTAEVRGRGARPGPGRAWT